MATIECPSCGLPRTDDLAAVDPCPICGNASLIPLAEDEDEPDHDRPWLIDEPQRPSVESAGAPPREEAAVRRGGMSLVGGFLGFILGLGAGAGGVLAVQAYQKRQPDAGLFAEGSGRSDDAAESGDVDLAPRPREVSSKRPASAAAGTARPAPTPLSKEPVLIGPPPQPVPVNPFRPVAPRAERLRNPEVYAPFIPPGGSLVVRGQVRRLIVSGLEKGAVLDCIDLEAQEVVVVGKIDGGSRLSISAPGGKVRFLARVDGGSVVDIRARGGSVSFETPTANSRDGSRIGGGSLVDLQCRGAVFRGDIAGAGTRVAVTLDPGGSLEFARLDDHARLEYSPAGTDPEPRITKGQVRGKAILKYLD